MHTAKQTTPMMRSRWRLRDQESQKGLVLKGFVGKMTFIGDNRYQVRLWKLPILRCCMFKTMLLKFYCVAIPVGHLDLKSSATCNAMTFKHCQSLT